MLFIYQLQYFLVFQPKKYPHEKLDARFTPLEIYTQDGTALEGVIFTPEKFHYTILYFGARSQDSVGLISKLATAFVEYRIITVNYRGYGDSKGVPSEQTHYEDALHVSQKIKEHYGDFALVGFSIGSSVAAYVASKMDIKKVFLLGAFDSIYALMRNYHIPSFLIRYRFDTLLHVSELKSNLYLVASVDDKVVPIENLYNLKSKIKNLVEYKELSRYNHDEILFSNESIELIKKVLK